MNETAGCETACPMLELLVVITFFGYIYYLRNYADLRTKEERAEDVANGVEYKRPINARASNGPLFDKKMLVSSVMVLFTSALVVAVVKDAESIHFPYLVAVLAAIIIGFVEPHRGWLLALMQCGLMAGGYFLFTESPATESQRELENFSLYGAMILTFVASFLGAFMKRALNMK